MQGDPFYMANLPYNKDSDHFYNSRSILYDTGFNSRPSQTKDFKLVVEALSECQMLDRYRVVQRKNRLTIARIICLGGMSYDCVYGVIF